MHLRAIACLLTYSAIGLGVFAGAATAGAEPAGPRPVAAVLELFTSQGCSSCPPADRLFEELARDQRFIVLSLPIDYWDRLGWKDTFAKHAFTERQRAYASVRGDHQIYTPQAVVNGAEHANGASLLAIEASAETTSPPRLPVSAKQSGGEVEVTVGGTGSGSPYASIVLMPYLASRQVAIGRGENAHTKITYTNIVREIVPVGEWTGKPVTLKAALPPAASGESYDGAVVLVQEGTVDNPGAILGATRIDLGPAGNAARHADAGHGSEHVGP